MFRKNKYFLFQGPLNKQETESFTKEYKFKTNIILCGTYAKDVFNAIGESANESFETIDEKMMYAVQYCRKGTLEVDVNLDITADVEYQENRKKEFAFQHTDRIKDSSQHALGSTHSFKPLEPDFKSNVEIYVAIASKDDDECRKILDDMTEQKYGSKISRYMVLHDLQKTCAIEACTSGLEIYSVHSKNPYQDFAKRIEKELEKKSNFAIKEIEQKLIADVRKKMINEFRESLHQQAEEYFAKHPRRRCSLM